MHRKRAVELALEQPVKKGKRGLNTSTIPRHLTTEERITHGTGKQELPATTTTAHDASTREVHQRRLARAGRLSAAHAGVKLRLDPQMCEQLYQVGKHNGSEREGQAILGDVRQGPKASVGVVEQPGLGLSLRDDLA